MNDAGASPSSNRSDAPTGLTFGKATDILWECAWQALMVAFFVQLFGTIAFGLVSGLWSEMAPSLPPGFGVERSESSSDFSFFHQHRFALLFALFFFAKVAGQFASYSSNEKHRNRAAWAHRFSRRLSEQWFSVVVINAFVAFGAVVAVKVTQQFSLTHWLWQSVADLLRSAIYGIASLFPAGVESAVKSLTGWYDDNQFKCMFWLFYSAAICDDLGLPNYKTLGRSLWRRLVRRRKSVAVGTPASPSAIDSV